MLSGQNTLFRHDRVLGLDSGSILFTGVVANLAANRVLTGDTQSFLVTGNDAGKLHNRLLSGDYGSFLLTGNDADFVITFADGKKNLEILLNIARSHQFDLNIVRDKSFDLAIKRSIQIRG